MDAGRRVPAKIGRNQVPAGVCRFWLQGNCSRSPCKFLHSEAPSQPTQLQVRKRPNPSLSEEDHREKKRFTWRRNPIEGTVKKEQPDLIGTITLEELPAPVPSVSKKAQKRLCNYWANGSCVHGDKCIDLHSWFSGSGFSFVAKLEGHKKGVTGVSFPSGSDKLFSGSSDGCFNVWDCNSGKCVFSIEMGCKIGCVINSEEGPWLFVGLEDGVKMYNLEDQTEFHLTGPNGLVRCLNFDVLEGTLFGGVEDGSVLVWKATPESSIPIVVATYKGHQQAVLSLFVGRSNVIYSASEDKTIRVWDRKTSDCLFVLNDHTASVTCLLCWEHCLITGSLDHSVKMWESAEDGTLKVVCQVEDESGVLALRGTYDKDHNPILLCSRTDNTVRLLSLPTLTERGRIFTKAAVQTISVETFSQKAEKHGRLFFTGDATGQLGVWRMDGQPTEQV